MRTANASEMLGPSGRHGQNAYGCSGARVDVRSARHVYVTCCLSPPVLLRDAVRCFYDEIKLYNYDSPGFSMGTGHFTQVVWKETSHVGVGINQVTSFPDII